MAALPKLRQFNVTLPSGFTASKDSVAASPSRVYISAGNGASAGLGSKIFVFDWYGNRQEAEEFTFPAAFETRGIAFRNTKIYQMYVDGYRRVNVREYTLSGVLGQSYTSRISTIGGQDIILHSMTARQNDILMSWKRDLSRNVLYNIIESFNLDDFSDNSAKGFSDETDIAITDTIVGLAHSGNRVWMALNDSSGGFVKIAVLDQTLSRVATEDIKTAPTGLTSLFGVAWNGSSLAVLSQATGQVHTVHLYGDELPPEVTPDLASQQYDLFDSDYEQKFDVVTPGKNVAVSAVKAVDIPGLMSTSSEGFSVSSSESIGDQLNSVNFIPRWTLPNVARGDVFFIHTGEPGQAPTQQPAERYAIQAIREAGATKRQIFIGSSVT